MHTLLTPRKFADLIQVKVRTVWKWIRSEGMPARNRGREENPRYLCDEESFNWYIRKKTRPANRAAVKAYPEYSTLLPPPR